MRALFRKRTAAFLSCVMLLGCMGSLSPEAADTGDTAGSQAVQSDGGRMTVENEYLRLTVDTDSTNFTIRDRLTGREWSSVPADWESHEELRGNSKSVVRSMLSVRYIPDFSETALLTLESANSYSGSVRDGNATVSAIKNGIRVEYFFADTSFRIPVEITLEGKRFRVAIINRDIAEEGKARVYSMMLLPYLCSGCNADEGFLFIPHGCGAIMNFRTQTNTDVTYGMPVYGSDAALEATQEEQTITVPVYGVCRNATALTAIIDRGAEYAYITAGGRTETNSYCRVGAEFYRRFSDSMTLFEGDSANERVIYRLSDAVDADTFALVCALSDSADGYAGLARQYRGYLQENGILTKTTTAPAALHLQVYGAITRKSSFLGFPYDKKVALTTFEQAGAMLQRLNDSGIAAVSMSYVGWSRNGVRNTTLPVKAKASAVLGGARKLTDLLKSVQGSANTVTLTADLMNFSRSGYGFSTLKNGINNLFHVREKQMALLLSSGLEDKEIPAWSLLNSGDMLRAAQKMQAGMSRWQGVEVSFAGIGEQLYADYSAKNAVSRAESVKNYQSVLQSYSQAGYTVSVGKGNAYTFGYADRIDCLPSDAGGYGLFDESVPFLAIVLHGYIPYTASAGNRAADPQMYLLSCLETGSDPLYQVIGCASSAVADTAYSYLYSTNFDDQAGDIQAVYAVYDTVYRTLCGQEMISHHRVAENVFATAYADGTTVYVNYGDTAYAGEAVTVPAKGYGVRKEGGS